MTLSALLQTVILCFCVFVYYYPISISLVDEPKVSLYGRETDHLRSACRCVA